MGFIGAFISFVFATIPFWIFGLVILSMFFKVISEYERGVLFTLGRYAGLRKPGLNFIIPFVQRLAIIDKRITTVEIPKQEVMTKDNVPVMINAVIYFKVSDPDKAVLNVEDFYYAVSKYGQTSLRNVAGEATLDQLLSERQEIAEKLRNIVDVATDPWGLKVDAIELQDIELPLEMKRVMAKQAEAEREKRAVIIKAEGEVAASKNIAKAAEKLSSTKGALHLRTLESLNDISSDQSNKIVFVVPLEVLRGLEEVD
ncbi:MAG: SPFH domain-containing protein [Candidatus Altiarchaeota archaeon]